MYRKERGNHSHIYLALLLFVSFVSYYHFLSVNLPVAAGPDEKEHASSIAFIYKHGRLATYPEDVDKLYLSPYGTTRVFSRPFPYVFSALVAKLYMATKYGTGLYSSPDNNNEALLYASRQGNVALAALGVVLLFLILYFLTHQAGASLLTAVAFGLLPQFAFLASYSNNDIAAVFVLLTMFCSVIFVAKNLIVEKTDSLRYVVLGIACGLVLLSKPTIWVPALIIALFPLVSMERWLYVKKLMLISVPVAVLVSGWWFAFNSYHHGVANFTNKQVKAELRAEYQTMPDAYIYSFSDIGHTVGDMLRNERSFLTVSYKSSIGYLDYFKLPLGALQYQAYGVVLALGGVCLLLSILTRPGTIDFRAWRSLAVFMLGAMVAQFCVYVAWNYVKEIQTQGKYLLPSIGFLFVGFGIFVSFVFSKIGRRKWINLGAAVGIVVFAYVHFDALARYVIPFYKPGVIYKTEGNPVRVPITKEDAFYDSNDVEVVQKNDNTVLLKMTGPKPWVALRLQDWVDANSVNYIEIEASALMHDWMSLYWDYGNGFRRMQVSHHALQAERATLGLGFPRNAKKLALNMGERIGNSFELHAVTLSSARPRFPFGGYQ